MKVLIFGATGGTGRQLIERSLASGYVTSAYVHAHPEQLGDLTSKVTVYEGDVRDFDAVDKAIASQDAVLVALGVIPGRTQHILSKGTANIIRSMENNKVKRLVVVTGAGLVENHDQIPFVWRLVSKFPLMNGMFDDKRRQEASIRGSSLEWVIVRPANLTNGRATSNYRTGDELTLRTASTISRADVADFMVKQVESPDWLGKAVLIESAD